ncbi:MAG: RNB domain-containing ribonuclease [Candidatus Acidiferrum sp.]
MSRSSQLSPENLLRFLQVKSEPTSANDISHGLHLGKSDRRPLFKILTRLKKRNAIEELPGGRYRLSQRSGEKASGANGKQNSGKRQQDQSSSLAKDRSECSGADILQRNEIKGRLVLHHDGYGFVVPSTPVPQLDGDLFIPPGGIEGAMHGDRVVARIKPAYGVTGSRRAEGAIVRIVGRAHTSVVGLFRYGSRGNTVLPYDVRIQQEIEIPAGDEVTPALREKLGLASAGESGARARRLLVLPELDGAVVNVELTRYSRGGLPPTGRVTEILGRPGDMGVDIEIIIRKHHLPHVFSRAVLDDAERRAVPVSEAERSGREDFRDLPIVTIDGETARDFDDAVHVERTADGGWRLQVHIADVSHYVRVGDALDQEARLRGTSVYFPDRAVPMLPESLSNGMCSLKPHEDRLVLSALMEFDAAGNMQRARMTPGVIRSFERMTYTNVNKVIEKDPEMTARYAPLVKHFANMKELALLLNARRNEHGSIDFDLPEQVIAFDDQQRMVSIGRSERNIAHRLIEEFMLAANRAVDSYLAQRGIESLHRVHEQPDAKKVLEFEELARAFGYSLGVENLHQREIAVRHGKIPAPARAGRQDSRGHGRERGMKVSLPGVDLRITPQHYQRLIRKVTGKPEERIVSYLMLRSLKQARYAAEALGHFALGFDEYTHFTSPIRRYPDLIVHRILKWALEHPHAKPPSSGSHSEARPELPRSAEPQNREAKLYSLHELGEMATETSEAERRATGAERELMDWKTAQFMEQHLGEEYDALIISVQKYGCFVELFEVFVEGLLPVSALEEAAGTRCAFREGDHAIVSLAGGGRDSGGGRRGGRRDQPNFGKGRGAKTTQRKWSLGDTVRVRAERIDPTRKRVEFALVESPAK